MLLTLSIVFAGIGAVTAQDGAKNYFDPETGITFSSYSQSNGVSHRVALPLNSSTSDAIFQISSPTSFKWCGLAWGGQMTNNPLSVTWLTGTTEGEKAIVSSRMAFGYYAVPQAYDGATYTLLHAAVTADKWSVTARCQGCTQWSGADGDFNIQNRDNAVLAYACANTPPANPSRNDSTFNAHDQFGIWGHDLTIARNASYGSWIRGTVESLGSQRRWTA